MINKVILVGNAGNTPEIRNVNNDVTTSLRLATSERFRDRNGEIRENTEWHNVVLWGKNAEFAGKHVQKGNMLYIEGKLRTRQYDGKDGVKHTVTEVVASVIRNLTKKASDGAAQTAKAQEEDLLDGPIPGIMGPEDQQQEY